MKKQTFDKRNTFSKGSKAYTLALELLTTGKRVRTAKYTGSKRYCTLLQYTYDTAMALSVVGLKKDIDFIVGNDAPRGGGIGDYIELTSKGKRKMIKP